MFIALHIQPKTENGHNKKLFKKNLKKIQFKKLPVFLPAVWLSKQPGQVFDIILALLE